MMKINVPDSQIQHDLSRDKKKKKVCHSTE